MPLAPDDLRRAALLADPRRRGVYTAVREAGRPVTREEVATLAGVPRRLAAFHLEKLLEAGLLRAHYARPPGRGGPGAGRSAKYYEPSDAQIQLSLPSRRYDLAASLLVEAVRSQRKEEPARRTLLRVAAARGRTLGAALRSRHGMRRCGAERALSVAEEALAALGFEPHRPARGVVALRNCPFDALAAACPEVVCEMNRAFLEGLLRGLGNDSAQAVLDARQAGCCVTLRSPKAARRGRDARGEGIRQGAAHRLRERR